MTLEIFVSSIPMSDTINKKLLRMKNGIGTSYVSESPSGKRCLFIFVYKSNTCHQSSTVFTQGVTTSFATKQSCLKLPAGDRKLRYTIAKQVQPDRLVALEIDRVLVLHSIFLDIDIQALILKNSNTLCYTTLQLSKQHIS